jgi:hypothetical protein
MILVAVVASLVLLTIVLVASTWLGTLGVFILAVILLATFSLALARFTPVDEAMGVLQERGLWAALRYRKKRKN